MNRPPVVVESASSVFGIRLAARFARSVTSAADLGTNILLLDQSMSVLVLDAGERRVALDLSKSRSALNVGNIRLVLDVDKPRQSSDSNHSSAKPNDFRL